MILAFPARPIISMLFCLIYIYEKKKIGIIGLGNPLRRDDGIGLFYSSVYKHKKKITKKISNILMADQAG